MDWTALLANEKLGPYSGLTILIFILLKWGNKILEFALTSLGVKGDRRWQTQTTMREELDGVKSQMAAMGAAVLLVCEAYDQLSEKAHIDADKLEEHLRKTDCLDDLTSYILDTWRKIPSLDEIQERQRQMFPNLFPNGIVFRPEHEHEANSESE